MAIDETAPRNNDPGLDRPVGTARDDLVLALKMLAECGVQRDGLSSIRHAEDAQQVTAAMSVAVRAMAAATYLQLGECQKERPFAPLRPVIGLDGKFSWRCSHKVEHSAVLSP